MGGTRARDFSGPSLSPPPQGESRMQYAAPGDPPKDNSPVTDSDVNQSATSQDPKPATIDEALTALQPLADEARMLEVEGAQLEIEKQWAELRLKAAETVESTPKINLRPGAPVAPQVRKQSLSLSEIQALNEKLSGINDRLAAIENRQDDLDERVRVMLAIPREMQGQVKVRSESLMKAFSPDLYNLAMSGNDLAKKYIHASLLPEVSFSETTDDRAGYDSHTGTIWINPATSRPDVVMHEVTHGVEWKPTVIHEGGKTVIRYPVMEKAHAFLMKRAGNEKPQRMKDLDPKNAHRYRDDEMAYEDQWKEKGGNPYSGKVSGGQSTEILTVGIQRFYRNPLLFLKQDPEYFTFVISTLRYPQL